MKVKVMKDHPDKWEFQGVFPNFQKGTPVNIAEKEDEDFLGWYACDIEGHKSFIPKIYVSGGKLNRDYNPTELIQKEGDILEVKEIVYAWLLVTNDKGTTGWIPAENVVSIETL